MGNSKVSAENRVIEVDIDFNIYINRSASVHLLDGGVVLWSQGESRFCLRK